MALAQKAFSSSSRLGPVRVSRTSTVSVVARESRIGSKPITIPKGVTITVTDGITLKVKVRVAADALSNLRSRISWNCNAWQGPKGELVRTFLPAVKLEQVHLPI